jgi:Holliday junction resolvase RusA-like endonuclease
VTVSFSVTGLPASQGSKTAFRNQYTGRVNVVQAGTKASRMKFGEWRQAVTFAARVEAERYGTLDGELYCRLTFYLPKPKSRPKRDQWCTTQPDLDKLIRTVFDALTLGTLVADDARIVYCEAAKRYAVDHQPGVTVQLGVLSAGAEQAALFDGMAEFG